MYVRVSVCVCVCVCVCMYVCMYVCVCVFFVGGLGNSKMKVIRFQSHCFVCFPFPGILCSD
jgi:hypothetical protein